MPRTGEELLVEKQPGNSQDRHVVALVKDRIFLGHFPRELSSTFWYFLSHEGSSHRDRRYCIVEIC